ncbi:thioredoxin domain-containing protein 5 [Drosophila eugracilis]|uniref:thioredoxin domain-containing protein 5 n=1 Tax=Drosophila eugracilis TaxID=29029 RepID=UPI0007E837E0|nr:thioredoxin domain-containing protein 5 [Drosophila eugracilis]
MSKFLHFQYLLILLLGLKTRTETSVLRESENLTTASDIILEPRDLSACSPGKIFELTKENYHETTETGVFFVKLYMPRCRDCEDFELIWTELAQAFKTNQNICFAKLNCRHARIICNGYESSYGPTLVWVEDGVDVTEYDGNLNFEEISKFINDMTRKNDTENAAQKRFNFQSHTISVFTWFLMVFM